jgi:hypothetical protein
MEPAPFQREKRTTICRRQKWQLLALQPFITKTMPFFNITQDAQWNNK